MSNFFSEVWIETGAASAQEAVDRAAGALDKMFAAHGLKPSKSGRSVSLQAAPGSRGWVRAAARELHTSSDGAAGLAGPLSKHGGLAAIAAQGDADHGVQLTLFEGGARVKATRGALARRVGARPGQDPREWVDFGESAAPLPTRSELEELLAVCREIDEPAHLHWKFDSLGIPRPAGDAVRTWLKLPTAVALDRLERSFAVGSGACSRLCVYRRVPARRTEDSARRPWRR